MFRLKEKVNIIRIKLKGKMRFPCVGIEKASVLGKFRDLDVAEILIRYAQVRDFHF